jgi:tetratricopeptide (TPR) repeat protein
MPRAPTEIPHLAFTHHRVGIHKPEAPPSKGPGALKPFFDLSWMSDADRQYALGLASIEAAEQATNDAGQRMRFQKQAFDLLTEVREAGMKDAVLDAALARLHSHMGIGQVEALAESALSYGDLDPLNRCNTLALVANERIRAREHARAIDPLRQLITWRRHPIDWLLLSDCEGTLGNSEAQEKATLTALRINPRLWGVHKHLADQYRRQGKSKEADWHQLRAAP